MPVIELPDGKLRNLNMSTIEPRTFSLSRWPIFALLVLSLAGASIHAQELGQWSFADGT